MNNDYIEFKKKRELGDILTDTFAFLRQNIKPLFSVLMKTCGIPFIVLLLAYAYYAYETTNLFDPQSIGNGELFNSGSMIITIFVMLAGLLTFYSLLSGTVLHYIKVYMEGGGTVDKDAVTAGVKTDFGSLLGLTILSGIIIGFGFVLCFFPGVYLYVPMSLVFSILIFRNVSVTDSISESFQLIKNEWWITFATLFVLGLIIGVISMIFSIPAFAYTLTKTVASASEGTLTDPSEIIDWIYITLTIISSAAKYALYVITVIASAFIYFNLNERKHFTGTLEQIDSLGKSE